MPFQRRDIEDILDRSRKVRKLGKIADLIVQLQKFLEKTLCNTRISPKSPDIQYFLEGFHRLRQKYSECIKGNVLR